MNSRFALDELDEAFRRAAEGSVLRVAIVPFGGVLSGNRELNTRQIAALCRRFGRLFL